VEIIQATTISSFPQLKRHKGKKQFVFSQCVFLKGPQFPQVKSLSHVEHCADLYFKNLNLLKQWSKTVVLFSTGFHVVVTLKRKITFGTAS